MSYEGDGWSDPECGLGRCGYLNQLGGQRPIRELESLKAAGQDPEYGQLVRAFMVLKPHKAALKTSCFSRLST
jgi:hypothetical protein